MYKVLPPFAPGLFFFFFINFTVNLLKQGVSQIQCHHKEMMSFICLYIVVWTPMSTVCFISLKGQVIFSHRRVRVEMDCSPTTLIFKDRQQLASPSSIIWLLADTHGLLSLGNTQAASKYYPMVELQRCSVMSF